MKKLSLLICFSLALCLSTGNIIGQEKFSLHIGPALPLGPFGSDNIEDDNSGGAAVGLNIGMQYQYTVSESGFGVFGGVDLLYNGLKKSVKDDYKSLFVDFLGADNVETYMKYVNIPVSFGISYSKKLENNISLFGKCGFAANFLKVTDTEVKFGSDKATTEMDWAKNMGIRIGAGAMINEHAFVSLDYYGLGNHDLKGKAKMAGESEDVDGKLKVDALTITVGYAF